MGSGRGRSVLLVEDDADIRLVSSIALGRVGGFEVTGVGTVADARAALARGAPDVILLDVHLPDLDGPSFARELAAHEMFAHVPIVLLTGHPVSDDLPAHVIGAIQKPFDAMTLAGRIRTICGWA
ncbi:MAG: response regulator [Deltaproteobacteria bacterium]|nr:response regulator [Deltaproteobacteria bacterium]